MLHKQPSVSEIIREKRRENTLKGFKMFGIGTLAVAASSVLPKFVPSQVKASCYVGGALTALVGAADVIGEAKLLLEEKDWLNAPREVF